MLVYYTTMDYIVLSVMIIVAMCMACLIGMVYQKSIDMEKRDELSKIEKKFDGVITAVAKRW